MKNYTVTVHGNKIVSLTPKTHYLVMLMVLDHSEPSAFNSDKITSVISGYLSERHIIALFFIKSIYRTNKSDCTEFLHGFIDYVDTNNIDLFWAPGEEKLRSLATKNIDEIIDINANIRMKDVSWSSVAHVPIRSWFDLVFAELPDIKEELIQRINPQSIEHWWFSRS